MAAIGGLTANCWRGTVQGEQKPVEVVTRSGVAGTGLLVGAYQATPYEIETEYYSDVTGVGTWRDTALAMVGTSVSITDHLGAVWSDTAVLGFAFVIRRVAGLGANTHLITARWHLVSEV